jgi:two-component system, LytTR family, response regulator LytT
METQFKIKNETSKENTLYVDRSEGIDHLLKLMATNINVVKQFFQQNHGNNPLTSTTIRCDKKSFLVFKHNKYTTVATQNIAFFHIKHESSMIMCFDRQEYFVNHSLEQIQNLITDQQFFRLNRQYLINFAAIKEVEHYFARKLLVNLIVPVAEKLLIPKEKATNFLHWLDNR